MGWKGMLIGGFLGHALGPLGSLIGAALGHEVEKRLTSGAKGRRRVSAAGANPSIVFCASVAAMLAKIAKADGRVTQDEISQVENAFARLGFSREARQYAINVFRRAKDDAHTIYEYAEEFAAAVNSVEVREVFYEILWDVACADGSLSPDELAILQRIPAALRIRSAWYGYFASQRMAQRSTPVDELSRAYTLLGASETDSAAELKRKYRELAKKHHPDALRAQGLPEEMVGKATEKMARINEAWQQIKEARGL